MAVAVLLPGVSYADPITVNFAPAPDGASFVLTLSHTFHQFDPAPDSRQDPFWLINFNVDETRGGDGDDILQIGGDARHIRGPIGDPHGMGALFPFNFSIDATGMAPGPKQATDLVLSPAHGPPVAAHFDEYRARLGYNINRVAGDERIGAWNFSLTGTHVPAPPPPVPEPSMVSLISVGCALWLLRHRARRG